MTLLISALLVAGGLFGLIGSFGLIRLPEPMQRLHAPTKATTLAVGAVLCAAALSGLGAKYLLIAAFLFVTAPVSALFLAKALRHSATRGK